MITPTLDPTQPPFDQLSQRELATLEQAGRSVQFATGQRLLEEGAGTTAVHLIQRGRVRATRMLEGTLQMVGEYGSGDMLGVFAAITGRARYSYEALEPTDCLAIEAAAFVAVQAGNPSFSAWFMEGLAAKRQRLLAQERSSELADTMLTRVGDAQLAPALHLPAATSLRAARAEMKRLAVSCALVDADAEPLGIVTRTDLLDALALYDMSPAQPIGGLVRRPLLTIAPDAALFQALVAMTEHQVERVVVADGDTVLGTLGMTEVLSHYSSHSHLIGLQLARATRVEEVRAAALRTADLVRSLHAQGARMRFLTDLISALNGHVLQRLWELLIPPAQRQQMCLLVLGSEGRREQLLKTDQDNALILADGFDWPGLDAAMRGFSEELQACGWPPCPGGVMVCNPIWRHSVAGWQQQLQQWARSTDPRAMLDFAIAIDARPVAGELGLYEQLRPLLLQGGRNDIVLHHFAGAALAFHTPLTLFGNLRAGEHGTDIKKGGVFPLVHGLRALALRHGVADRNSFRRATAIAAAGGMSAELARDVQQALGVFLRFRLGQQLDAMRRGEPPDNYLRPAALRRLDRELLRDALAVVDAFKAHVKRSFHL